MRSGREHLAWMIVVEVRQHWKTRKGGRKEGRKEGKKEGKKEGRKATTNIKSNNPHLAGGEKRRF